MFNSDSNPFVTDVVKEFRGNVIDIGVSIDGSNEFQAEEPVGLIEKEAIDNAVKVVNNLL